jgi:hypothetical protein
MAMTSLAQQRNELKSKLSRTRVRLHLGKYFPICAGCDGVITDSKPPMHEALLSRGDVQGSKDRLQPLIMVKENCVLMHIGCHVYANTPAGQRNCIKHLITYEGYDVISDWLLEMRNHMITSTPCDARRLLKEVYYDPRNVWNLRPSAE